MGLEFTALMKYTASTSVLHEAVHTLRQTPSPVFGQVAQHWQNEGYYNLLHLSTAWVSRDRPPSPLFLFESILTEPPTLPSLTALLCLDFGFLLTFGTDAIHIYYLLPWEHFVQETHWQTLILAACTFLGKHFGCTDGIITHDTHPSIQLFWQGSSFDQSLAVAHIEDAEVADIAEMCQISEAPSDLVIEPTADGRMGEIKWRSHADAPNTWPVMIWQSHGYWRWRPS